MSTCQLFCSMCLSLASSCVLSSLDWGCVFSTSTSQMWWCVFLRASCQGVHDVDTLFPVMSTLISWLRWCLLGFFTVVTVFPFIIENFLEKRYFKTMLIFTFSSDHHLHLLPTESWVLSATMITAVSVWWQLWISPIPSTSTNWTSSFTYYPFTYIMDLLFSLWTVSNSVILLLRFFHGWHGGVFWLALMFFWHAPTLGFICSSPCSSPRVDPFCKEPCFLLLKDSVWNQEQGSTCGHCY